jgi:hypothetical protein
MVGRLRKSVESIRQDFYAKQVAHNLTALLAMGAQARRWMSGMWGASTRSLRPCPALKNQIIHVLRVVTILPRIRVLLERCAQNIDACRPDRRFMRRVSNLHQNLFFTTYKACR